MRVSAEKAPGRLLVDAAAHGRGEGDGAAVERAVDGAAALDVPQEVRERDRPGGWAADVDAVGLRLPDGPREIEVLEVCFREADGDDRVADGGRRRQAEVGAHDAPARVEEQASSAVPDGGDDPSNGAAPQRRQFVGAARFGRREVGLLGDAGRGTGHDERVAPGNVEEALRLPVLRRVGRRADASARRDFGADEPFGRKGEEVAFDEGVDASVGAAEHKENVVGVGRVDEGIDDGRVQAHALAVVATAVEVGCRDVGTVGMPGGLRQKKHRGDQRSEHDVRIISYSPARGPPLLL